MAEKFVSGWSVTATPAKPSCAADRRYAGARAGRRRQQRCRQSARRLAVDGGGGDAQALFADPALDLIVIPTPNDTHFPLAQQALAAGKHVVVDKPFTVTLSQAQALQQQAQQSGLLLSVFHNRRWDSDFLTLKALLNEGRWARWPISSRISIATGRRCASAGANKAASAAASGTI